MYKFCRRINDFMFLNLIYPLFGVYLDAMVNYYRLAQVKSLHVKNGPTYAVITKHYPVGTDIQFYEAQEPIKELEEDYGIVQLEKIIARGEVVLTDKYSSVVLLKQQRHPLQIGCLAKTTQPESVLYSLKECMRG